MSNAEKKLQELIKGASEQENSASIDLAYLQNKLGDEDACRLELLRIEVKQRQEQLDSTKQDRAQRKEFAGRIFSLLCCYLLAVLLLLLASGWGMNWFSLSENVLLMLLGTTTANIIALFRFVARYLFK